MIPSWISTWFHLVEIQLSYMVAFILLFLLIHHFFFGIGINTSRDTVEIRSTCLTLLFLPISFGSVDHYYNNYAHIKRIIVGFDRNWGDGIEPEVQCVFSHPAVLLRRLFLLWWKWLYHCLLCCGHMVRVKARLTTAFCKVVCWSHSFRHELTCMSSSWSIANTDPRYHSRTFHGLQHYVVSQILNLKVP